MSLEVGTPVLPALRMPDAAARTFLSSLKKPSRLLVAISGGSDSTGLLLALNQALTTGKFPHSLCAVTVDHGLRAASAAEALEVGTLCQTLSIPHQILLWAGEKPKTGLSAAARSARYRLLAQAADAFGADALVTGHTVDDQVETITMRAERSSEGALGLSGMASATLYERRLWILRPFLDTSRTSIRTFLQANIQGWIDDPSNEDIRSERVRIRHRQLEPDLAAIVRAGEERRRLAACATAWLAERAESVGEQVIRLRLDQTTSEPAQETLHALSTLCASLGGRPHRPATAAVDRLAAHLGNGANFALTLAGCLIVRRKYELYLTRERRGLLPLPLPAGESLVWDGRYEITNQSRVDIHVAPGPAPQISANLPHRIRSAMAGNSLEIRTSTEGNEVDRLQITLVPRLSLFDPFLPDFDLPLADEIARLLGREAAIACPV